MNRDQSIDIMKGIGIITVVIGHFYSGLVHQLIFLFHMPLFFVIGGFLFNPKTNIKSFFIDKCIHLLIPYFIYLLLIYFFTEPISFTESKKNIILSFIKPLIGGRFLTKSTGVFWFVTCFFVTQQLFNLLILKISKQKNILIIIFISLLVSYINSMYFPELWLPLNINVVFASLPFFTFGYYFKKQPFELPNSILIFSTIVIFSISIFLKSNTLDMKYANYGIPFLTTISSIVIIMFIKLLAQKIKNFRLLSNSLSEIGKASMVIMYLHLPIKYIMKDYFHINNLLINIFVSFFFSFILYYIFMKFKISKALLIGSKTDFHSISKQL